VVAVQSARTASPAGGFSSISDDPLIDGFEDYDSTEFELGPGDSQYELTSNFDGIAEDASSDEVPAWRPPQPEIRRIGGVSVASTATAAPTGRDAAAGLERTRIQAASAFRPMVSSDVPSALGPARLANAVAGQLAPATGRAGGFIEVWSRYQLPTTLVFAVIALGTIGFFLLRSMIGGELLTPGASALLVGLLAIIAFVLLSLTAITQTAPLVELAHELRRARKDFD
jgi:hypothetical protein